MAYPDILDANGLQNKVPHNEGVIVFLQKSPIHFWWNFPIR